MKFHKLYYIDHADGYHMIHEKPCGKSHSLGLSYSTADGTIDRLSVAVEALNNILNSGEEAKIHFPSWNKKAG